MKMQKVASVILHYPDGTILLYLRDDKAGISFPNHWDLFGGFVEEGETPEQALLREVEEELNIRLQKFSFFRSFVSKAERIPNVKFVYHAQINVPFEQLKLNEGQRLALFKPHEIEQVKFANILKEIVLSYLNRDNALNFRIEEKGAVSAAFLKKEIFDFFAACHYIQQLPYKRNKNKSDGLCVLKDEYGTCSTKHAVLKQLCIEQNAESIELICGIFMMNAQNTPSVSNVLAQHHLTEIPEAHTYLKQNGKIIDCTKAGFSARNFEQEILEEYTLAPNQIGEEKIKLQKNFIEKWLKTESNSRLSLNEIWEIREQCIRALENN